MHCWVRHPERTGHETVGLRVLGADGTALYAVSAVPAGGEATREGWFDVRTTLEFNVAPGTYMVESYVWDEVAAREMETGPTLGVTVTAGPAFIGLVQMNARSHVPHAAVYGEANSWAPPPAAAAGAAAVGAAAVVPPWAPPTRRRAAAADRPPTSRPRAPRRPGRAPTAAARPDPAPTRGAAAPRGPTPRPP
jgi:hypothetical protein